MLEFFQLIDALVELTSPLGDALFQFLIDLLQFEQQLFVAALEDKRAGGAAQGFE